MHHTSASQSVRRAIVSIALLGGLASCFVALPRRASADSAATTDTAATADTVYTLPAILVQGTRIPARIDDVFAQPGFVAVLDLGERRHRVEDLSTVLSQMVGVRVKQYGGLGGFATVSIRGSSANQVDIFLDGIPLNDAYTGATNLGALPLDGIAQLEVFRGSTPPHLGSSAIGGAVNLVTTHPGSWPDGFRPYVDGRVSYGSFDTSRFSLSLRENLKLAKVFLSGGYLESQGDFTYVDDRATPENPDDDRVTTRVNNDFTSLNLLGRIQSIFPVIGEVALSHNALSRKEGVPGVGTHQSLTARSERETHLTHLRMTPTPILHDRLQLFGGVFYSYANEKFSDPDGDIGLVRGETDNTFTAQGGNFRTRFEVPRVPLALEYFYEEKQERYHPTRKAPTPTSGPDGTRRSRFSTISGNLVLRPLNAVVTASQRYQKHTNDLFDPPRFPWLPPTPQGEITRRVESPQFGFRWMPTRSLTLKGNWGEYYRVPTLLELYGNTGSVTGNALLEPEEGLNRDIGVTLKVDRWWALRSVFLEAIYLDNDVQNLILFFPNSQQTSKPRNIGSATIRGVELSMSANILQRIRLGGNYARLETEDTGPIPFYNGNELPGRPRDDLALFVDYTRRRWRATYEFHYLGENFLDPANLRVVPERRIHNFALRLWPSSEAMSLALEARNITNDQISDVSGFPLPGRSYYATVNYQH